MKSNRCLNVDEAAGSAGTGLQGAYGPCRWFFAFIPVEMGNPFSILSGWEIHLEMHFENITLV